MTRFAFSWVTRRAFSSVFALAATMLLGVAPLRAAIISGAGTGDITFHSTFFADGVIAPSHTTGTVAIPMSPGSLTHEVFAPSGLEHSYMSMSWDFTPSTTNVFVYPPSSPTTTTRLELVPSPPVPAHHAATMTGTFEILYTLDGAGLATTIPAQVYKIASYINPAVGSPSGASFDAHWDYTDVGFGLLGFQDIHYSAPGGFGVVNTVSSLPLGLTVPAGHTTLKVSGFFKLTADSDDFMGGGPPFDTFIAIIPEPSALVLAAVAGLVLSGAAFVRRRRVRQAIAQ